MIDLTAGADDDGRRLDRILRKALPELPLSMIHRLLRKGRVLVAGKPAWGRRRIRQGDAIHITGAASPGARATIEEAEAPLPPSWILAEFEDILIINKPAGLAVHGAGSLDGRVGAYLRGKRPPSLSFKPGPLHRLDKPASGIIVFSKTLEGARLFSALMRQRRLRKIYLALAEGHIAQRECWEDLLIRDRKAGKTFASPEPGARLGLTSVFPLVSTAGASAAAYTLVKLEIHTGRTHQIRAQAALRGHPLAGDRKYGGSPFPQGPFLHARSLEFPPDLAGGRRITAPLPAAFRRQIALLFRGSAALREAAERAPSQCAPRQNALY
ncbi:MAG: RluA family pseudouridine synthase [Treponema sp.]|jgi:23S rRNA pseudouridine955/2504/2580 synthase|nr:RluA family pseudouridine synthase [Treponema sp.]